MEHKVSAQRRLVPGGNGPGNKDFAEDDADKIQLENLGQRQVIDLPHLMESPRTERGVQEPTGYDSDKRCLVQFHCL